MRASVYSGFTLLLCAVTPSKNQWFSPGERGNSWRSRWPNPEENHPQKVATTATAGAAQNGNLRGEPSTESNRRHSMPILRQTTHRMPSPERHHPQNAKHREEPPSKQLL